MRKMVSALLCAFLCITLAGGCGAGPSPEQGGQTAPSAAAEATETPEMASPSPTDLSDPYREVVPSATVGNVVEAERAADPVPLEMTEGVAIHPRYDLPGESRALAVMEPERFAVIGVDGEGRDCLYGGEIYADAAPRVPFYTAEADYPRIVAIAGGYGCVYVSEANDAAWRVRMVGMMVSPNEGDAPVQVDHGEGPAPRLSSSEGELVYAVETADGYGLRVFARRDEAGGQTEALGVIPIPQDTLEPGRAYAMNAVGVTHVEAARGGYLAIAENLDGIQAAIASPEAMYGAQIGSLAVAWLDGEGAFCVYDPEADATYRYGGGFTWFAPRDGAGEGAGYLFGGEEGLYIMAWDISADPSPMAVYPLAEGDGWAYRACVAVVGDINIAYVLRQQGDWWQLAYIELNEAFG